MVPFTPAVLSLPKGLSERDVFDAPEAYATRMIALAKTQDKPFVVVVDAGGHYDPMCAYLEDNGVPVFREGDRAALRGAAFGAGGFTLTSLDRAKPTPLESPVHGRSA
ncbi:MAG: hypothetical protein JRH20_13740 [Deltaproteobacteria bacterium]|nr:hypothetical protein [Deltaproteobacteria bacterium]